MAAKRHKPEEIVSKLRQVEVLVGQGMARIDAIRDPDQGGEIRHPPKVRSAAANLRPS